MTIRVSAKCDDRCSVVVRDDEGRILKETHGYVPKIVSKDSDYVDFEIDLQTGRLTNWRPPSLQEISDFLQQEEE